MINFSALVLFVVFIEIVFAKSLIESVAAINNDNQTLFEQSIIDPLKDEKVSNIPLVEPPPLPTVTKTEINELKAILPNPIISPSNQSRKLDTPLSSLSNKIDVKEIVKEVVKEAVKEVVLENTGIVGGGEGSKILPAIDLIKTCTPDCTLPHCTEACKCANTHADAQAKCNPPPNAPITELCHIWYAKCPMFHPLMFDATGPTPFL